MKEKEVFIGGFVYESPDKGKTIYRRKFGDHPSRELLENVINKLYCPICGKEMTGDIHVFDGVSKREIDNWVCVDNPDHHCVVFSRDDIKGWLEEEYKKESGL